MANYISNEECISENMSKHDLEIGEYKGEIELSGKLFKMIYNWAFSSKQQDYIIYL